MQKIAVGAAILAVAVFSAGCGGSGSRTIPPPSGITPQGAGKIQAVAAVPAAAKYVLLAPLRLISGPPATFQYVGNPKGICLPGSLPSPTPSPRHGGDDGGNSRGEDSHAVSVRDDNRGGDDGGDGSKYGPIVKPRKTETLPVGAFALRTACVNVTPSPSPSPTPTPAPTATPGGRSVARGTLAVVVPTPTPTPAPPTTTTSYYVVAIDLANTASPTVASGPATVASNALNFPAASAPLTLNGGSSYVFALASRTDTVPVPTDTPSPVPTDTPLPTDTPVPTTTPPVVTPSPVPTISPCPGAVSIATEGTYCSWAVPHPPVDMAHSNPDLLYSSNTGAVVGHFTVQDKSTREIAIAGTPYAMTFGHNVNVSGAYVGVSSPTNNLVFIDELVTFGGDVVTFPGPPSVPASPHNIAGGACGIDNQCADVVIANGDVYLYSSSTKSIEMDIPLTNPVASASLVSLTAPDGTYDVLALTPDRHIVYATIDSHGGSLTEHLLPDVLPAGYRFTDAVRNASGFQFVASDYQYGSAPQGHGIHTVVDLTSFASRNLPFDNSGGTCDAMGLSTGAFNSTYFISCVNAVREYNQYNDAQYHYAPVPADGAITYQVDGSYNDVFFTSYQTSSIYELQYGQFFPSVTPLTSAVKRKTAVSAKHH